MPVAGLRTDPRTAPALLPPAGAVSLTAAVDIRSHFVLQWGNGKTACLVLRPRDRNVAAAGCDGRASIGLHPRAVRGPVHDKERQFSNHRSDQDGDRRLRGKRDRAPRVLLAQAAQRGVSRMADVATDLKQRLDWAMDVSLEAYEVLPDGRSFVRSDEDERAIGIFETLHDTVDVIPPSLITSAEELRATAPELFEKTLVHWIGMVGSDFSPANAAAFVEILNWTVQRDVRLPYFFAYDGEMARAK